MNTTMQTSNSIVTTGGNQQNHDILKGALIGGSISLVVGGVGTYFVTKHIERKKARKELERCKSHFYGRGYDDGYDKAREEAQAWIDENLPKAIEEEISNWIDNNLPKAVDEAMKQIGNGSVTKEDITKAIQNSSMRAAEESEGSKNDQEYAEKSSQSENGDPEKAENTEVSSDGVSNDHISAVADDIKKLEADRDERIKKLHEAEEMARQRAKELADMKQVDSFLDGSSDELFEKPATTDQAEIQSAEAVAQCNSVGDDLEFMLKSGDIIKVPRNLLFDDYGQSYGPGVVRQNIREYFGRDVRSINRLWKALGFGEYVGEELDLGRISPDELSIDNIEVDDDSSEEAYQKSIERERYLDKVDKYREHLGEGPRIISRREFNEESYLTKEYIDYYAGDNVFVSNENMDKPMDDPFEMFGVVNGEDLFKNRKKFSEEEDDNDPDIVHIENFKHSAVFEITRSDRSYSELKDGRIYFDGNSDPS